MPNADVTKDGSQSLNNATFNVKTDSDTDSDSQTSVSSGDVKQNSDQSNAKFKIDLNKSALDNDQLMNDNLTITVKDSNGHTLGTISNVTANELLKAAQQQKASQQQKAAESQSSSATSQSSSSASSEAAQSSAVISSKADTTDPSTVVISSESASAKDTNSDTKVGADTAVSSANSSSAKSSDSSSKATDSNNGEIPPHHLKRPQALTQAVRQAARVFPVAKQLARAAMLTVLVKMALTVATATKHKLVVVAKVAKGKLPIKGIVKMLITHNYRKPLTGEPTNQVLVF